MSAKIFNELPSEWELALASPTAWSVDISDIVAEGIITPDFAKQPGSVNNWVEGTVPQSMLLSAEASSSWVVEMQAVKQKVMGSIPGAGVYIFSVIFFWFQLN